MRLGLDVFLEKGYKRVEGLRVGLVTNMTGVNEKLQPSIDLFAEHPAINLVALYAPEHGIRGDAKEGEKVSSSRDNATGLPVYSLYGQTRKPSQEMIADVDVLVFDLQDIGSRYYTYIYTMASVMEACMEYGKKLIVLDRPNPVSGINMEGNLVEQDVRSFVGLLPIPNRHGMTVGELALLFKNEFAYSCDLSVIPMEGWKRRMYFDDTNLFWVPPSPNTPVIDMAILYPGTCLIEGTNVSEGRGTTKPFEWIGAPFIDGQKLAKVYNDKSLPGVLARPISFVPTYQKYKGEVCNGVQLHIENRNTLHALQAGVALVETIATIYPNQFQFIQNEKEKYFFDLLAGTKRLRKYILTGKAVRYLEESQQELDEFNKTRKKYLLYR
ncbi:exo-beta-N-acetylmuramidase NamZ family protein [Oceanobacillus jeddahense]|uniref:exo-beta-N-acetylmuramidase NamZ family protein n=1 Tax=Oceanobacillus jeddahense TaxID=1462527 RepID=UPI00362CBEFB